MAGKTTSPSRKSRYAVYKAENIFAKNKVAKLKRHLALFPNDEIAQAALKAAPTAKSSRFGKKDYKSTRTHLDKITDPLYAQTRASARVYATVKDGEALILNGKLFSSEQLKEVFGVKATQKRADAPAQKSKVRRGKRVAK